MKLHKKLLEWRECCWCIGFIDTKVGAILNGSKFEVKWVKDPEQAKRWFADPFILDYSNDSITVLAEEFSYNLRKGRIAKLVINRSDYRIEECEIILELDTHLSFPFIFRQNGKVFIMPENSASGCLRMYQFSDGKLNPVSVVSEQPLTDATILSYENDYYLLSTQIPEQNGRELSIWQFDTHEYKTAGDDVRVIFPSCKARNAGTSFVYNGQTYRPAQDCNKTYGGGMEIQTVNCHNGEFSFDSVIELEPQSRRYNKGLHTFNIHRDLIVIDGNGYRYPLFGGIANSIYKTLSAIKQTYNKH